MGSNKNSLGLVVFTKNNLQKNTLFLYTVALISSKKNCHFFKQSVTSRDVRERSKGDCDAGPYEA